MRGAKARRVKHINSKPKPNSSDSTGRVISFLKGRLDVPQDFDAPLPSEVQATFEGAVAGQGLPTQQDGDEGVPTSLSTCTWNCRVIPFRHGEEAWHAIHEAYYTNGVPAAYSSTPAVAMWDPEEGDEAGRRTVDRLRESLRKPMLTTGDHWRKL